MARFTLRHVDTPDIQMWAKKNANLGWHRRED